jgi:hypothetical protein
MATLPSLPVELFHHIIDELPDTWTNHRYIKLDLKQFRFACREIDFKTRTGFSKHFFSCCEIRVGPGGFERAHQITADSIFRTQVEWLELCLDHLNAPFNDDADHKATTDYIMGGAFRSAFTKLTTQAVRVEGLMLVSPRVAFGASAVLKSSMIEA